MEEKKFCEHLEKVIHVPIRKFNLRNELIKGYGHEEEEDKFCDYLTEKNWDDLRSRKITLKKIDDVRTYGSIADNKQNLFVLGPVQFSISFAKKNQEKGYYCNYMSFVEALLMLYQFLTGEEVDFMEVIESNQEEHRSKKLRERNLSQYYFEQQENQWIHNSYGQEQREQNAIKSGDVKLLNKVISEPLMGRLGTNTKDRIRSVKNNCIALLAICSRSAIKGGMEPEVAFTLLDNYIMNIEHINEIMQITNFVRKSEVELATLVATVKLGKKQNPIIENCKKYIYVHMHEKISMQEMAKEFNMNQNYLSTIFHKEQGITLTDYIMNRKISFAQNLLIYSDYTYNDVAYYFGFSSRSHFGAVFKNQTGMTPKQYRDCNKVDFSKEQ